MTKLEEFTRAEALRQSKTNNGALVSIIKTLGEPHKLQILEDMIIVAEYCDGFELPMKSREQELNEEEEI